MSTKAGQKFLQDHDVYKKRLQADGAPIDEGIKHTIGPENLDLISKDNVDENGTACGSCYGAQTATQPCCNTCDEVMLALQALGSNLELYQSRLTCICY